MNRNFLPVEIEILYFANDDVIKTSPTTDDEADVVQSWDSKWN